MNDDVKNNSALSLSFVTIALVVISSLLRVIVGNSDNSIKTVSVLNLLMMAYVLCRIAHCVYVATRDNKIKDKTSKHQKNACVKLIRIVGLCFIIGSVIYFCVQIFFKNDNLFCIVNDVIAIVTFGVSIEEETIENLLSNHFKNKTFM